MMEPIGKVNRVTWNGKLLLLRLWSGREKKGGRFCVCVCVLYTDVILNING